MDQTFPLRRREIVEAGPPVKTLKEWWPALFMQRQKPDVKVMPLVVPRGLPVLLGGDPSDFYINLRG
ncbi:hypothetical protein CRENBAI_013638 [Crenichthys baileyi]|uniref:Uncharacterized protein n=1 Tax=Crenichthys baileyi TaxID=28760 RepID=A0AAV9RRH6_9TELE